MIREWKFCWLLPRKKKSRITPSVIGLAGRNADVVDIDAFALQNAFEANYSVDAAAVVRC